jgi:hypothetical protein
MLQTSILNNKECFKNSGCDNIIKAHSIQENKILKKIAVDGHVVMVANDRITMVDGQIDTDNLVKIELIGKGKATRFQGFCQEHDREIFKPIELNDYIAGNKEQNFLFAYRTLAKEFHAVKTGIIRIDRAIENAINRSQSNDAINNIKHMFCLAT